MSEPDERPTPDEVEDALRLLDENAANVDTAALQQIRQHTTRHLQQGVRLQRSSTLPEPRRRFPAAIVVLTASTALLLAALLMPAGQAADRPALSELVRDLQQAHSVSIEGERLGNPVDLVLNAPGIVRWNELAGRYRIADGHQLWQLNDQTGEIEATEASPLPAEGTDALHLLGLESLKQLRLSRVKPVRRESFLGHEHLCYETSVEFDQQPAQLVTYVRPEQQRIAGFRVFAAGNKGDADTAAADESARPNQRLGGRRLLAEFRVRLDEDRDLIRPADLYRSLKDDGRRGSLAEVHGLVMLRTFPGHRWTPATPGTPLFAGDQLRCESRGANAAVLRLQSGESLIAGPGSQCRLQPNGSILLQAGDLKVPVGVEVVDPDGQSLHSDQESVFRIVRHGNASAVLERLTEDPAWLQALNEQMTTETMGSLVAQVDDRDVSLTLGFHHVSVDIRNQIARTVIEESFVNNTNERLEGVFRFPLPHDASISGFGMWIGDQLVEADVVEKQRAREIYETILREKRDPGLLEWAGGNVFKARVFPIEPHSEKKIRITYTQTLPLQNGTYRYGYALRSEMLQRTPLRDLSIDVTLHSEVPLQQVHSPSHPTAAVQQTRHSASLSFQARDVTPQRDFEFICEPDERQPDVIAIPHIRGDDGYLMVQLSPPSVAAGNWSRSLVRDGTPLDVILVCDTSRSMDETARQQQADLAAAIMGSLGLPDRIRMVCCDVDCTWLQAEAVPASDAARERLLQQLQDRPSQGWSNLRGCLEQILKQGQRNTQVIYLGDGTVVNEFSEARADFLAWMQGVAVDAARFKTGPRSSADERKAAGKGLPTLHGIAVGNTFDMAVLDAMSRLNGGTRRSVAGSESAIDVARQLLFEITRPGLKDIQVQFRNLQVAAVHPAQLPNLADGMQHILTARFLPQPDLSDAEIVVTGRRGNERVRYVARLPMSAGSSADENTDRGGTSDSTARGDQNSFIPRLWAKAHIDSLLQEAATKEIQKQIVRLSQQYHLITPFTSLLVLETDADRKRFGVERHMQMRDGEEFFAEGRAEAEYSLRQQQLAAAKLYRQQLYQNYQTQIAGLSAPLVVPTTAAAQSMTDVLATRLGRTQGGMSLYGDSVDRFHVYFDQSERLSRSSGVRRLGRFGHTTQLDTKLGEKFGWYENSSGYESLGMSSYRGGTSLNFGRPTTSVQLYDHWGMTPMYPAIEEQIVLQEAEFALPQQQGLSAGLEVANYADDFSVDGIRALEGLEQEALKQQRRQLGAVQLRYVTPSAEGLMAARRKSLTPQNQLAAVEPPTFGMSNVLPVSAAPVQDYAKWPDHVSDLFPAVQHAAAADQPAPEQDADDQSSPAVEKFGWPQVVVDALDELPESLQSVGSGLSLQTERRDLHPVSGHVQQTELSFKIWREQNGWLTETPTGLGTKIEWSLAGDSGSWLPAFGTGRAGKSTAHGRVKCTIGVPTVSIRHLTSHYSQQWSAKLHSADESNFAIVLTQRDQPWRQVRVVLDRSRRCVLSREELLDGAVTSAVRYSQHVQIGELWLPGRQTTLVFEPVLNRLCETQQIDWHWQTLSEVEFDQATAARLPNREQTLLLPESLPTLQETLQREANDNSEMVHRLVRLFHQIETGRHSDATETLHDLQTRWPRFGENVWVSWLIRLQLRARESLRLDIAEVLAGPAQHWPGFETADERGRIAIADRLHWLSSQLQSVSDRVQVLQRLIDALEKADVDREARLSLQLSLIDLMKHSEQPDDARTLLQQLINEFPDRLALQQRELNELKAGDDAEAVEKKFESLLQQEQWSTAEWNSLYGQFLTWLRSRADFETAEQVCQRWTNRCPFETNAWEELLRCNVELDQPDETRRLRDQWLNIVLANDRDLSKRLPPMEEAQFLAAFNFGFGQMAGLQLAGPQNEIQAEMIRAADLLSGHERHLDWADRVLKDKRFVRQPAGRDLVKTILLRLAERLAELQGGDKLPVTNRRLEMTFVWLEQSGISGSDEHNRLLAAMRGLLDQRIDSLGEDELRLLLFRWGVGFDEDTPAEQRQAWVDALVRRWKTAETFVDRYMWSRVIGEFESKAFDREHQLKWYRQQLQDAADDFRTLAATELFNQLLTEPWSAEIQEESWNLIKKMLAENGAENGAADGEKNGAEDDADEAELQRLQRLNRWWSYVSRWTHSQLQAKAAALQKEDAKWDERSAAQRTVLQKKFRVQAIRHMLQAIRQRTDDALDAEKPAPRPLLIRRSSWLRMLAMQLQQDLLSADTVAGVSDAAKKKMRASMIEEIRSLLPDRPVATPPPVTRKPADDAAQLQAMVDAIRLQARHWLLSHWIRLGLQSDEESETNHADDILAYLRQGAASDDVAPRAWRAAEFAVLISLDRPKLLAERLQTWLKNDEATAPWRRHLGHLLAELDRLDEAIELYEEAGKKDLLTAADWKLLSVWQHTLDRRQDSEESLRQEWRHLSTGQKHSRLKNRLNQWKSNTSGRSPMVPADVKRQLFELMQTTTDLINSYQVLKSWYRATNDPLLLHALAPFVSGRSRPDMLQALSYTQSLINDLHQEAAIDALVDGISRHRSAVTRNSDDQQDVDDFGLNLLLLQARCRAARILNQPGPHAAAAQKALQAVAAEQIAESEIPRLVERLSHLGRLPNAALSVARRQLAFRLLRSIDVDRPGRLATALHVAAMEVRDGRSVEADQLLQAELRAYLANSNTWTGTIPEVLSRLKARRLEQDQFLAAERWLMDVLDRFDRNELRQQLRDIRLAALRSGGRSVMGEGDELYQFLREADWANVIDPMHHGDFPKAFERILQVVDGGLDAELPAAGDDVKKLAERADHLIRRFSAQHISIIQQIKNQLRRSAGDRAAVEFLLQRLKAQPVALQWTVPRSVWNQFADDLYEITWPDRRSPVTGEHERRLNPQIRPLRLQVEAALLEGFEAGLHARDQTHHGYFDRRHCRLYRDGRERVLQIVDDVAAEHADSLADINFLVRFLDKHFNDEQPRQIALLEAARAGGIATDATWNKLVELYLEIDQPKSAVALLELMIGRSPQSKNLRFQLMRALFRLKDQDAMQLQLQYVRKHLVDEVDGPVSQVFELAELCAEVHLWKEAADLFQQAFDRTPWPVQPDQRLADRWRHYTGVLTKLNESERAVDAISAAWVVVGQNPSARRQISRQLDEVLKETDRLDQMADQLDRRSQQEGDDSSFLRLALGREFLRRELPQQAESHLRTALELSPTNRAAAVALVESLDGQNRPEDAIDAVLNLCRLSEPATDCFVDLHDRYLQVNDPANAERAATSIVEVAVEESSSHAALAELREGQENWSAAIQHWRRAASLKTEEPHALVRLTQAQLQAGRKQDAVATFRKLRTTKWDDRFEELPAQIRKLRRRINATR